MDITTLHEVKRIWKLPASGMLKLSLTMTVDNEGIDAKQSQIEN